MAKKESAKRGYMTRGEITDHLIKQFPLKEFPYKEGETWKEYNERMSKPKSEYLLRLERRGGKRLSPKTRENILDLAQAWSTNTYKWASDVRGPFGAHVWLPAEIEYALPPGKDSSSVEIANYIKNYITGAQKRDGKGQYAFFDSDKNPRVSQVVSNEDDTEGAFVVEEEDRGFVGEAVYAFKKEKGKIKVVLLDRDRGDMSKNPDLFFRYVLPKGKIKGDKLKVNKLRKPSENDETREYDLESILSEKESSSSRFSSVIAIAGLGAGIFFLSSNITGNAIAEMTTKTTSFLGAGLVIVGLVAGFFWLKSRK